MTTDPLFRMTVVDVFSIRGRGTVVIGTVASGTLSVGDQIAIERQGFVKKATVTGIEIFEKQLREAKAGEHIGVLFRDIAKPDIQSGDVLTGTFGEFT